MRVEWATFVSHVSGPERSPTLHDVGRGAATVDELPNVIPLLVMVQFVTAPHEIGNEVSLGLEVADPRLETIHSLDARATPIAPETAIEGWEIRHWRPIHVKLNAQSEGVYTFRVRIDGAFQWELPFFVRLAA